MTGHGDVPMATAVVSVADDASSRFDLDAVERAHRQAGALRDVDSDDLGLRLDRITHRLLPRAFFETPVQPLRVLATGSRRARRGSYRRSDHGPADPPSARVAG